MEPEPFYSLSRPDTWPESPLERGRRELQEQINTMRESLLEEGHEPARIELVVYLMHHGWVDLARLEGVLYSPRSTEELWVILPEEPVAPDQDLPISAPAQDPHAESRLLLLMIKNIVVHWTSDDPASTTYPRIEEIRTKIGPPFAGKGERHFRRLASEALKDIGSPHTRLDKWIRDLPPEI